MNDTIRFNFDTRGKKLTDFLPRVNFASRFRRRRIRSMESYFPRRDAREILRRDALAITPSTREATTASTERYSRLH